MLARNLSLLSCAVAFPFFKGISFQRLARMETTAGLQTSQPCPFPNLSRTSSYVFNEWIFARSNNSWRLLSKCSHRTLRTYFPWAAIDESIISFSIGTHPPQPVPAFVHFFMASTLSHPFSVTLSQIVFLVTASQLHISAASVKWFTPAPPAFSPLTVPIMISSGLGGNTILFLHVCNNILYCDASPTNIPPSKILPSSLMLIRL